MDVELAQGPNECGVDYECDLVAMRPASAGAIEKGSRSPRGVEMVWRVGRRNGSSRPTISRVPGAVGVLERPVSRQRVGRQA
jgi:hypothetical protein